MELSEVRPCRYYVVEVELFQSNFRHRAIMATGFPDSNKNAPFDAVLWSNSYEDLRRFEWSKLPYYLHVLSEIIEMRGE